MADGSGLVRFILGVLGHILWHQGYLSFIDKVVQYYIRIAQHTLPIQQEDALSAKGGGCFLGFSSDGILQGGLNLQSGEVRG